MHMFEVSIAAIRPSLLYKGLVIAACLLLTPPATMRAQDDTGTEGSSSAVSGSGSATITGDFYDYASTGDVPVSSRRPPSLIRFIISPTLTFGGKVSLPFTIMFSSRETSTITPPIKEPTLAQFLQNQANSFSISPKFDWAQFHLGSHTPSFSELSVGNVQLFGVGTELSPGGFRFKASAGATQRAVEADTLNRTRGAFARHLYAASIGYGSGETEVLLNLVRARDDVSSIRTVRQPLIVTPDSADLSLRDTTFTQHVLMPQPEEGLVATISARVPIADGISLSSEAGAGLFTRDMYASPIGERAAAVNSLVRQRTSSRGDGAGRLSIDFAKSTWNLAITALYIGPGYVTLGFPYMQSDRLEFSLAPSFRLFDSVMTISGTFGHRTNNLSKSRGSTTTQILAAANVDALITSGFNVVVDYSNFGMTTDVTNDTFRVRTISQSFSVRPTLTFTAGDAVHTVNAGFALDDFDDLNPITGAESANNTKTFSGMYSASLNDVPLTIDAGATYLTNALSSGDLTIQSFNIGAGYRLMNGAVTPSLSATFTTSRLEHLRRPVTDDTQLGIRLSVGVRITQKLRLTAAASTNMYEYGVSRAGATFTENMLRTSLGWSF